MNIMERKPYEGVVKLIKDQKDLYLKNKIGGDIQVLFSDEDDYNEKVVMMNLKRC